jgi:hypothetical protein
VPSEETPREESTIHTKESPVQDSKSSASPLVVTGTVTLRRSSFSGSRIIQVQEEDEFDQLLNHPSMGILDLIAPEPEPEPVSVSVSETAPDVRIQTPTPTPHSTPIATTLPEKSVIATTPTPTATTEKTNVVPTLPEPETKDSMRPLAFSGEVFLGMRRAPNQPPEWHAGRSVSLLRVQTARDNCQLPFGQWFWTMTPGIWRFRIDPPTPQWNFLLRHRDKDPFRTIQQNVSEAELHCHATTTIMIRPESASSSTHEREYVVLHAHLVQK